MQATEQTLDKAGRPKVIPKTAWKKGQSGNPNGRKPYRLDFNAMGEGELAAQRIEAWRLVRSRKASPAQRLAALKLLHKLPKAERAGLATVLRDMAASRLPAVDQAGDKPAAEQPVITDEPAK